VLRHECRQPARLVGEHVAVQQQEQSPGGQRGARVGRPGEAEVASQQHQPERHTVQRVQLACERAGVTGELRAVQHVDQVRTAQLGVGGEGGHLMLEEVDPSVERDDDADVGRGRGGPVLNNLDDGVAHRTRSAPAVLQR